MPPYNSISLNYLGVLRRVTLCHFEGVGVSKLCQAVTRLARLRRREIVVIRCGVRLIGAAKSTPLATPPCVVCASSR